MALFNFDATAVKPQETSFSPIPAGNYLALVTSSEMKLLKSGNGTGLSLQLQIVDGQYANRRIFANINVQHNNPKAESIGQGQLSQLCHAVGILQLKDTSELHNIPVTIKVKIRIAAPGSNYDDSNEIVGYEAANGSASHAAPSFTPQSYAQPTPAPAAANGGAAPWAVRV